MYIFFTFQGRGRGRGSRGGSSGNPEFHGTPLS